MADNSRIIELYQQALKNRQEQKNVNKNAIPTEISTSSANNQNPSVLNRIVGTGNDISNSLVTGVGKGIEGIIDFGATLVGNIGNSFGADTSGINDFIAHDYTTDIIESEPFQSFADWSSPINIINNLTTSNEELKGFKNSLKYSYVNELPDVAQEVIRGSANSIGQILPSLALGGGSAALGFGSKVVSLASFGLGAAGTSTEEALNQGNDLATSTQYGLLQGAKEMGTEWLGGKLFGSKIFGALGNSSAKATTQTVKSLVKEFAKESISEGAEEVIGDLFEPIINKLTINKDATMAELWSDSINQMPLDFITGAVTGGVMNGVSTLNNVREYGVEGARIGDTISRANEIVNEAVKLEKQGKTDSKKFKALQTELAELSEGYTKLVETINNKYGAESSQAENVGAYQDYMDNVVNTSTQDIAINETINKYNKQNKTSIGYKSLNVKDYKESLGSMLDIEADTIDDNSNAFIDKKGNIYVNKDSTAYKEGKLYNTIGHEFMHSAENTDTYKELFDNYKNSLSESETNDIIKMYQNVYGTDKSSDYLMQEVFADYIGKNITTDYKEFSKTLGTNSKLSSLIERIFGSKSTLSEDSKTTQRSVKKAINESNNASEGTKESKSVHSGFYSKKVRRYITNAEKFNTRYEKSVENDVYKALKEFYREYDEVTINDFVVVSGNKLLIIDSALEDKGHIAFGVYKEREYGLDIIMEMKKEVEAEINEGRKYNLRKIQNRVEKNKGIKTKLSSSNGQLLHSESGQSIQSGDGKSEHNKRGVLENNADNRGVKESKETYTQEDTETKKLKQTPKITDSAVAQKAFAHLTQGKVYNKTDVAEALKHFLYSIKKALGNDVKVSIKNRQGIIDNIFNKLNTQVNNDISDIAYAFNECMENLLIEGKSVENLVEYNGESYKEFVERNTQTLINLLENGKQGKVSKILKYYTNVVSTLKTRLFEAKHYSNELRKTYSALERTIESHIGKEGTTVLKAGIGITELNPILKKLKDAQKGRTDYIKGDVRLVARDILELFQTNEYLKTEGVIPPEVISELQSIIANIGITTANGRTPKLSIEEMKSLRNVCRGIDYIYKTYDTIVLNEQTKSLKETTDKAIKDLKVNPKYNNSALFKLSDKTKKLLGLDKLRVKLALMQNKAYDGSFGQELELSLRNASNKKYEVRDDLLNKELRKEFSKNKDKLTRENFKLESGISMTDDFAITLYMYSLREKSRERVLNAGVAIQSKNGFSKETNVTEADLDNVKKYVESNYDSLIKGIKELYHNKAQKWYNDTLEDRTGYRQELEDNYFPMKVYEQELSKSIGASDLVLKYQQYLSPSFTKEVNEDSTTKLKISGVSSITERFVTQMSNYAGISPTIQQLNRLLRTVILIEGNETTLLSYIEKNIDPNFSSYINTLLINMQGRKTKGGNEGLLSNVRGLSAMVALGANVKVFLSQVASLPMAIAELGLSNVSRGAISGKVNYKFMTENSSYFRNRFERNGAKMSQNVVNEPTLFEKAGSKVSKVAKGVGDIASKPISFFDRFTIGRIYNASIIKVAKDNKITVNQVKSNETLMLEALNLCEEVVRRTQPQYDVLENGSSIYEAGELKKSFYMYTSVLRNYLAELVLKTHDAVVSGFKNKQANKVLAQTLGGFIASQVMVSLLGTMFKDFLNKLDRDDDEEKFDDYTNDFLMSTIENTTINMIPFAKDIYNYLFKGYEISNVSIDFVNQLLKTSEYIEDLDSTNNTTRTRATYNVIKNLGMIYGIPVKNVTEYTTSLFANYNVETAIKTQNALYFVDNSEAKTNMTKAYNKGLIGSARANLGTILETASLTTPNVQASTEIARLYSLGYQQVIPSTSISSFTVDSQTYTLTDKAQKQFAKVYDEATKEIEDLVASTGYKKLKDEDKAKAIKRLYNAYYGIAKSELISQYETSLIEDALYEIDGSKLVVYLANIDNISATQVLSRKQQVLTYINKLSIPTKAKDILINIAGYGD